MAENKRLDAFMDGLANDPEHEIPTKVKLWRLTPGSHTIDWVRVDKTDYPLRAKIAGYISEPAMDIIKVLFYYGLAYGLYKAAEQANVIHLVKEGIEKLL